MVQMLGVKYILSKDFKKRDCFLKSFSTIF